MMAVRLQHAVMLLGELLDGENATSGLVGSASQLPVLGLSLDSRRILPGEVFIALAGSRSHGLAHAQDAIARGASAILYDPAALPGKSQQPCPPLPEGEGWGEGNRSWRECFHDQGGHSRHDRLGACSINELTTQLPCIALPDLSARLGFIASRYHGHPSRYVDVIGITGTNGKTSCSHYLSQALADSKPCAVMGTQGWGMPGELSATANTTPDALTIHGAIASLLSKGIKTLAMEVSSHGLHQGRVNGVHFKGAVFTNISRDHLDYHGDMHHYRAAKLQLLRAEGLQFVAANRDDASFAAVRQATPVNVRLLPYSAAGQQCDGLPTLLARDVRQDFSGIGFSVHWQHETAVVRAPLFGSFNVDNLLATLAVLLGLGHGLSNAAARLAAVRAVPGRMERFASLANAPTVIVDYAHTPDALELVLHSLRGHTQGRLFCVFGCGGDRDQGKRPQMGRIAARWADQVVVTDDNPRYEDGEAIVTQILAGCGNTGKVKVERDRRQAIAWAIQQAQRGDVVLVAGKGHESTQETAGVLQPFSDRAVVREALGVAS